MFMSEAAMSDLYLNRLSQFLLINVNEFCSLSEELEKSVNNIFFNFEL